MLSRGTQKGQCIKEQKGNGKQGCEKGKKGNFKRDIWADCPDSGIDIGSAVFYAYSCDDPA